MNANLIGDTRAEQDHSFLDKAFYPTPEFKTLLECGFRKIVVGRRGTGKSALFYQLERHFTSVPRLKLVTIAPTDAEMIGFRYFVRLFGDRQTHLRAASNQAWEYALLNKILVAIGDDYHLRKMQGLEEAIATTKLWKSTGKTLTERMCRTLENKVDQTLPEEKRVANLARQLALDSLRDITKEALDISKMRAQILVDRLDEGYEPDAYGTSAINGLLYALNQISHGIPAVHGVAFIRDNILRAIQRLDPDYSRNTEGDVLRLHWDENQLFNMVCARLRVALSSDEEQDLKVWKGATAHGLEGRDGFKRCLRLTLYRPRDLIVLLNKAFYQAFAHERKQVVADDVDASAKEISSSRLDDLRKEYAEILPGLDGVIDCFSGGKASLTFGEVTAKIEKQMASQNLTQAAAQFMAILKSPLEVVRVLYSVGFLGVWQDGSNSFVFCHDGKQPEFSVTDGSRLLVHPCYWMSLNLYEAAISTEEAEQIHDDYDIEVKSETPEIRIHRLGQMIAQLDGIKLGKEDAGVFEDWCCEAVKVLFAGSLVNVELHPNRVATQRRDIVARNIGGAETWRRVLDTYGTRQVIFEVKNYAEDLGGDEYRQMLSYLSGEYGRLGFIITRAEKADLERDRELRWAKEMFFTHDKRIIVKLTAKQLAGWLSKIRSFQKHNAPDKALGGLLDRYVRLWLTI